MELTKITNLEELVGYSKALNDLQDFIKDRTEFRPKKRMMDSVDILDNFIQTQLSGVSKQIPLIKKDLNEVSL